MTLSIRIGPGVRFEVIERDKCQSKTSRNRLVCYPASTGALVPSDVAPTPPRHTVSLPFWQVYPSEELTAHPLLRGHN